MGMRFLETGIWGEVRTLLKNPKMRLKDIMEWSSGPVAPQDGEIVVEVDFLNTHFWVAVKKEIDKR